MSTPGILLGDAPGRPLGPGPGRTVLGHEVYGRIAVLAVVIVVTVVTVVIVLAVVIAYPGAATQLPFVANLQIIRA